MKVVGRPKIVNELLLKKRLDDILASRIYSNNGPYVEQLEAAVEDFLGVKYAIAVNNATSGLETCLAYLKTITSKDQILLPSFTFVGTAAAVVRSGFTPVFVDIRNDFSFDLLDLDKKITKKTAGVMPCNLFGNRNPLDYVDTDTGVFSSNPSDLFEIFDSAHALGVSDGLTGKYVGNFGNCEVISLHPTKLGGAWEGGIITTNDPKIAEFAVKYRNFGFNPMGGNQGEVSIVGGNFKMCEAQAAAALCQIENIEEILDHYYGNFIMYRDLLPPNVIICEPNTEFSNYSYVVIRCNHRDELASYLYDKGVFARTYFQPIHKMEPYKGFHKGSLPMTDLISSEVLTLPTGLDIGSEDISRICDYIREFSKIKG